MHLLHLLLQPRALHTTFVGVDFYTGGVRMGPAPTSRMLVIRGLLLFGNRATRGRPERGRKHESVFRTAVRGTRWLVAASRARPGGRHLGQAEEEGGGVRKSGDRGIQKGGTEGRRRQRGRGGEGS